MCPKFTTVALHFPRTCDVVVEWMASDSSKVHHEETTAALWRSLEERVASSLPTTSSGLSPQTFHRTHSKNPVTIYYFDRSLSTVFSLCTLIMSQHCFTHSYLERSFYKSQRP